VELMMTELGPNFTVPANQAQAAGLFSADAYLSLMEQGFVNVDWLELHNGSFLAEFTEVKGPAYNGIQMAHHLAGPGDSLVSATSDQTVVVAHAAQRADGTLAVLLMNTQPDTSMRITVHVDGMSLASGATATRYDYAPSSGAANGSVVGPAPMDAASNDFSVDVPAYTAVDVVLAPGP